MIFSKSSMVWIMPYHAKNYRMVITHNITVVSKSTIDSTMNRKLFLVLKSIIDLYDRKSLE
jgi:hypothetical protein